jgi:dTDP-4-dehydrorhamnose reductase
MSLEIWGGVECTINRVGGSFHDQLRRSGHLARPDDIDRFTELGLSALRFPLVWERACSCVDAVADFTSVEPILERAKQRGLRVIAGLCHHGSGPSGTDLLDPLFEYALARYALQVAQRYPWIEDYTPINEPLTTARFSCLYGHWYPHQKDTGAFLRAVVHQCSAVARAMEAIRTVQPRARLVQTEDMATVRSSPTLDYQARYENHRRFLSLDLLCGRVDTSHPLYCHLRDHGIREEQLTFLREHACTPDVMGINYYFTSDRYLDADLARHPADTHGGNGRDRYADVDAARAGVGIIGHLDTLQMVWDRYRAPVAISEVHAGCTREEQLRWFCEAWEAAQQARAVGVDVRAVTAWALLGSFDWNSLVTVEAGVYESGLFDLRSHPPRQTALAHLVKSLHERRVYEHPVLASPGWWRRSENRAGRQGSGPRPLVIAGAPGALAHALARVCERRGLAHSLLTRAELDIADVASVGGCLASLKPWAVVNAAGFTRIDDAETQPDRCARENSIGPQILAAACKHAGIRLLTFSSDLVFDGRQCKPYVESDSVRPLCTYGSVQAAAERAVLELFPDALIVRTSGLFGPWDSTNIVTTALRSVAKGKSTQVPASFTISPTYMPHLIDVALDLLIDGACDLWHLSNIGSVTWAELAHRAVAKAKLDGELIRPASVHGSRAQRPSYSVLGSERGRLMPTLEDAVDHFLFDARQTVFADLAG